MINPVPPTPLPCLVSMQRLSIQLTRRLLVDIALHGSKADGVYLMLLQSHCCLMCHRAAFQGRIPDMLEIVSKWSADKRLQFDPQGNTVGSIEVVTDVRCLCSLMLFNLFPLQCFNTVCCTDIFL